MKVVDVIQGGEPWAEQRRGLLTASRMGRLITPKTLKIGAGARSLACELLAEELVPPHYWIGDDFHNAAMEHGTVTEQEARNYFELETGLDVQQVGFILSDCGRMGCSPDGLVGEHSGLELKCPLHRTQIAYLLDGGLPAEYAAQVHGSMIVTGRVHWSFMSYAVGLRPLLIGVERNEYTEALAAAIAEFWTLYDGMKAALGDGDPVAATRESKVYF